MKNRAKFIPQHISNKKEYLSEYVELLDRKIYYQSGFIDKIQLKLKDEIVDKVENKILDKVGGNLVDSKVQNKILDKIVDSKVGGKVVEKVVDKVGGNIVDSKVNEVSPSLKIYGLLNFYYDSGLACVNFRNFLINKVLEIPEKKDFDYLQYLVESFKLDSDIINYNFSKNKIEDYDKLTNKKIVIVDIDPDDTLEYYTKMFNGVLSSKLINRKSVTYLIKKKYSIIKESSKNYNYFTNPLNGYYIIAELI